MQKNGTPASRSANRKFTQRMVHATEQTQTPNECFIIKTQRGRAKNWPLQKPIAFLLQDIQCLFPRKDQPVNQSPRSAKRALYSSEPPTKTLKIEPRARNNMLRRIAHGWTSADDGQTDGKSENKNMNFLSPKTRCIWWRDLCHGRGDL